MEETRSRSPSDGLSCLACRTEADARTAEVLLCAECLARHHPACWAGACFACGGTDALPVRAPVQTVGPTIRVIAPTKVRRTVRVKKLRVLALVVFCVMVGVATSFGTPQRTTQPPTPEPVAIARNVAFLPPVVDVETHPKPAAIPWVSDEARLSAFWSIMSKAREKARRGDFSAALADYDRAVAIGPELAASWIERSRTRGELRDLVGAREDAIRATELDPENKAAWFQRGFRGGELGLWSEAEAEWTRTLELTPNDVWPWNNRGFVRAHGGDPQGAIADCTRAIQLEPGVAYAWNNRAWAKLRLGDPHGAWDDVTRSLQLDPQNAWAYETRARIGLALGHSKDGIRADLERCLALDAYYLRAEQVRATLQVLNRMVQEWGSEWIVPSTEDVTEWGDDWGDDWGQDDIESWKDR